MTAFLRKIYTFLQQKKDRVVHGLFEVTILMKGIHGIWETALGALFFFIKTESIYKFLVLATDFRVVRMSDFTTNYLTRQADNFSLSTQHFIAFYFLFYGLVNLFLVYFLSQGKLWAYPCAIVFFAFFILYQFYRYFLHHSGLLLFFSLFDICLVVLTWMEYRRIKSQSPNPNSQSSPNS